MTLSRFLDGAASVIVAAMLVVATFLMAGLIVQFVAAYPVGALTLGCVAVCVWAVHRVMRRSIQ